jgi:hypothetical protein
MMLALAWDMGRSPEHDDLHTVCRTAQFGLAKDQQWAFRAPAQAAFQYAMP